MRILKQVLLLLATTLLLWEHSLSLVAPQRHCFRSSILVMDMSAAGNKKRRRRKEEAPTGETDQQAGGENSRNVATTQVDDLLDQKSNDGMSKESSNKERSMDFLKETGDVSKFTYNRDDILKGIGNDEIASAQSTIPSDDSAIPLPDIKEVRQKKLMEEELARMEEEREITKPKIKRSDRAAFMRLLEQQPFSDADDSLFEEEAYTSISALLGERSAKFIGIPAGPIQVGHFIGALGVVLMAFVEYPGFPLTNLPGPLRGALQGGLGVVYSINTVLAVVAAFQARQRGQPIPLWVAKTWAVGGLAYDQLTQLPTLESIEQAKSIKGARAIKKR